jgi:hypothetical protein
MGMIDGAVNGLNDLDTLFPVVQELGRRQPTYGVKTEHPDTLGSHSNLADWYFSLGRCEEAIRLDKGTVGITERAAGREHPYTLNILDRLASAYRGQGQ